GPDRHVAPRWVARLVPVGRHSYCVPGRLSQPPAGPGSLVVELAAQRARRPPHHWRDPGRHAGATARGLRPGCLPDPEPDHGPPSGDERRGALVGFPCRCKGTCLSWAAPCGTHAWHTVAYLSSRGTILARRRRSGRGVLCGLRPTGTRRSQPQAARETSPSLARTPPP